jgi:hypothetical protein
MIWKIMSLFKLFDHARSFVNLMFGHLAAYKLK